MVGEKKIVACYKKKSQSFLSLECDFGNRLPEAFPLNLSNFKLQRAGLALTLYASVCSGTPGRS